MARVGDAGIDIAKMTPNERFEGAFCISNAQIGKTRTDKPYLRCTLGDATGRAPGRMRGAVLADCSGQPPGVDAADANPAPLSQPRL